MQPAFLSLMLLAVHASLPAGCRMGPQNPERRLQHQQSSINAHADALAGRRLFHLEPSGLGSKDIRRHFLVILPLTTDRSDFVSIFDLRRRRFLCVGSQGKLYSSRQKDREHCLFRHTWSDPANHRDVFYSASGGRLLGLEGAGLRVAPREAPGRPRGPWVKRQRRSEEVNPSDPLRSESNPPKSDKDHLDADHGPTEQDQTGAVSKETITSCDDPLRVLQPNGPVSPVKTNIADRAEQI